MQDLSMTLQQVHSGQAKALQQRLAAYQQSTEGKAPKLGDQLTEFASFFILQALQAMRRTVPQSGLLDTGFAHDLYMSLFDQEIAQQIARREGMGLVTMLRQQVEARHHATATQPTTHRAFEAYHQHLSQEPESFSLPVDGPISSPFGWRQDPFESEKRWHHGIDIAAPDGAVVRYYFR